MQPRKQQQQPGEHKRRSVPLLSVLLEPLKPDVITLAILQPQKWRPEHAIPREFWNGHVTQSKTQF